MKRWMRQTLPHPFEPYTARAAFVGLLDHVRGWFIPPAPEDDRCWMGSHVDPWVHCPRWCEPGAVFCRMHGGIATERLGR